MKMKSRRLEGLQILVGRARHQARALSSALRELGAEVLEIPFIEIRKPKSYKIIDGALKNLESYDWLILTSVNGVEMVWERLNKLHITITKPKDLKIAAIGPATASAIEKRGVKVDVTPNKYVAEFVVKSLRTRVQGKRVLLARAKLARDVIPTELRKLGAHVDVVEAYETVMPLSSRKRLIAALSGKTTRPDLITFTSSSTVKNFIALNDGRNSKASQRTLKRLGGIRFASIGPVTSGTLRQCGLRVDIEAKKYTIPGLVKGIVASLGR
jgi:uroporphyrinogen-III synthase